MRVGGLVRGFPRSTPRNQLRRCLRFGRVRRGSREFDVDLHRVVGNRRLLGTARFGEVDDAVLVQEVEIVVDLSNVPVEASGEIANALGGRFHQTSHEFQAARRENALEATRVLKVDDVWHRFALLPAFRAVQDGLSVLLERLRRDAKRRG